jgi:lipoprotein-anchoring transpeptidase ErfK/SrfK
MAPLLVGMVLGGTGIAVVVLYWLKPPPRRMVVPSKLLWDRLLKEKRRSTLLDRLRWWISLMIALAIGLSVAAAMGRPELSTDGGVIPRMTIVIDNSATMAARSPDGFTRWEHAVALARGLLDQGTVDGNFLILDTSGQAPSTDATDRRSALNVLDALSVSMGSSSQFPGPIEADGPLYYITDGVSVTDADARAKVLSVYTPGDNVGITAFEVGAVPSSPLEYQAFLEITNASLGPKEVSVRLTGTGAGGLRETITLQGGETRGRTIDLAAFERGAVRATITTDGDAFSIDDAAFRFLPVRRRTRITLVTPGSVFLQSALSEEPRLSVSTLRPQEFDEAAPADLYIFDRWAPETPPPGPALLFLPPNVSWLAPTVAVLTSPNVEGWDASHPLMRFVSLDDLRIDRAVRLGADPGVPTDGGGAAGAVVAISVVVGSADLPLVTAVEAPQKVIRAGFALEDSNFALQPAFPIFLSNVLSWMMDEQAALPRDPGRVEVALADAEVTDSQGEEVETLQASGRTVFLAEEPGLYTVSSGTRRIRVAVGVSDRDRTAINASSLRPEDRATAPPAALRLAGQEAAGSELWVILMIIATLLVILEWFTYHRRWTV